MEMNGVIREIIDQALLQVHTGFVARVVSVAGDMASVQPLSLLKGAGEAPRKQAMIENCPILKGAVSFTDSSPPGIRRVQAGDVVYCLCADRDISETRTGSFAVPVAGHHLSSSAVVLGILQEAGG